MRRLTDAGLREQHDKSGKSGLSINVRPEWEPSVGEAKVLIAEPPGKASKEKIRRPYPKPTQVDWLRRQR